MVAEAGMWAVRSVTVALITIGLHNMELCYSNLLNSYCIDAESEFLWDC